MRPQPQIGLSARALVWILALTFPALAPAQEPAAGDADASVAEDAAQPLPNVILILADDANVRSLGFSGGSAAITPELDALAAGGVVMDNAVHQGSFSGAICTVSRAMILTGRPVWGVTPGRYGYNATAQLETADELLPQRFRGAGYQTFLTGKWHNGEAALRRGFDRAEAFVLGGMLPYNEASHGGVGDPEIRIGQLDPQLMRLDPATGARLRFDGEGWSTDLYFAAVDQFLRQEREAERPFFVWLATHVPHDPRHAPQEFLDRFDLESLALPPNVAAEPRRDTGNLRVRDEIVFPAPREFDLMRREYRAYLAMVAQLDAAVGRLLATLDELGLRQDTILLFTSDHGLSMGEHGLMGKQNLDQASWRVPMLLAGPGLPAGERRDGFVYLHGVGPTLCELAGIEAWPHAARFSFAALARGDTDAGLPLLFGAYTPKANGEHGIRCVRQGRWKLVRYLHDGEADLFDLQADPWEQQDLADQPEMAERRASLDTLLRGWMLGSGDPQSR